MAFKILICVIRIYKKYGRQSYPFYLIYWIHQAIIFLFSLDQQKDCREQTMSKHKQYKQWTQQEDDVIKKLVNIYGTKQWTVIAQEMQKRYNYKNRTGKQCRQRWHNHLDPSINKDEWDSQEQNIMFDQHKKHGNKWTVIAQSLPGRNDNAIKNHFYSTVRRSIRRISKILGSKNSTTQMRNIKPSTLSKIFSIVTGSDSEYSTFPSQKLSLDHQNQIKLMNQNPAAYKLKTYLVQNCQDLARNIMEFANYKPTKKNSEVLKKNAKKRSKKNQNKQDQQIDSQSMDEQLSNFKGIIEKIIRINSLYQKAQIVQRRKRRQYLQSKGKDFDDYSDQGNIDEQDLDDFTPDHTKTPVHQPNRRLSVDINENQQMEEQISQQIINLPKQSTRSRRPIKSPTLYEPTLKIRKLKQENGQAKTFNQQFKNIEVGKIEEIKGSSTKQLKKQTKIIFQSPFKSYQPSIEVSPYISQDIGDQYGYPIQYKSFQINQIPELASYLPELSIRQDSGDQLGMSFLSPKAYSPYFSFPTPNGLTPKGNLFRQKSNISSLGSINFNNEDLDNYVNAFKKQAEYNTQGFDKSKYSNQISCSPKSAFRWCS